LVVPFLKENKSTHSSKEAQYHQSVGEKILMARLITSSCKPNQENAGIMVIDVLLHEPAIVQKVYVCCHTPKENKIYAHLKYLSITARLNYNSKHSENVHLLSCFISKVKHH
jgi:hypothetical protein